MPRTFIFAAARLPNTFLD